MEKAIVKGKRNKAVGQTAYLYNSYGGPDHVRKNIFSMVKCSRPPRSFPVSMRARHPVYPVHEGCSG